jgi:hypothetical protein
LPKLPTDAGDAPLTLRFCRSTLSRRGRVLEHV